MPRGTRLFAMGIVALALCPLVGCSSLDSSTYRSTIQRPTNVAVVDTVTQQTIWKMQVPVNHQLNVNFNRDDDIALIHVSEDPAQTMHWELSRINENKANDEKITGPTSGSIALSGDTVMTVVTYRTAPEKPGTLLPPYIIVQPDTEAKAKPAPTTQPSR